MKGNIVARRYAQALFELGEEVKKESQFLKDLEAIDEIVSSSEELKSILESPLYDLTLKRKILDGIIAKVGLSDYVSRFLGILLEKDRFRNLADIMDSYREFMDKKSGKVRVQLLTATAIGDDIKSKVSKALSKVVGKEVELEMAVDKSLIGGIIAEVEGTVYDGSIKTQLERIKQSLKEG